MNKINKYILSIIQEYVEKKEHILKILNAYINDYCENKVCYIIYDKYDLDSVIDIVCDIINSEDK